MLGRTFISVFLILSLLPTTGAICAEKCWTAEVSKPVQSVSSRQDQRHRDDVFNPHKHHGRPASSPHIVTVRGMFHEGAASDTCCLRNSSLLLRLCITPRKSSEPSTGSKFVCTAGFGRNAKGFLFTTAENQSRTVAPQTTISHLSSISPSLRI